MTNTTESMPDFVLRPLGPRDLEQSFNLASKVFAAQSTLHRALGIEFSEYRAYLWPSFCAMARENLSLVAVDPGQNKILGCLIATDFVQDPAENRPPPAKFAPLAALTAELARQYHQKRKLTPGTALLVDMGVVADTAKDKGIYTAMRHRLNVIARTRAFRFVVGELSSAATQHVVLNRMGHRKITEIPFAEFEFQGTRPFAAITTPPSIILSEGDLA